MAKSCYEYAMDILARYPKTEKELRIKMYQHGYDSEMVQKTLQKLKTENFLNDELFAESYLHSEVVKKGKPLRNLFFKNLQKSTLKILLREFIKESQRKSNFTKKSELTALKLFKS